MDISVVIVTYKHSYSDLKPTIVSVLSSNLNLKLYLVDNSPTPILESQLPKDSRLEYRFQNSNNGFGAAHNTIMSKPDLMGKYHLVLNPDVYFGPEVLDTLYRYMENNPDVGNVMPKVIYPTGELQYLCKLLPTPIDWIGRMFIPLKSFRDKINNNFEMRFADFDREMNVPYLSGCFMFLRKSVIQEIGLFDEGIFMYGEDTDLNRRIYRKYRTMYYPKVVIKHAHEKGSHKDWRLFKIHVKAAIYYLNKWGWFFDKERSLINMNTKRLYSSNK